MAERILVKTEDLNSGASGLTSAGRKISMTNNLSMAVVKLGMSSKLRAYRVRSQCPAGISAGSLDSTILQYQRRISECADRIKTLGKSLSRYSQLVTDTEKNLLFTGAQVAEGQEQQNGGGSNKPAWWYDVIMTFFGGAGAFGSLIKNGYDLFKDPTLGGLIKYSASSVKTVANWFEKQSLFGLKSTLKFAKTSAKWWQKGFSEFKSTFKSQMSNPISWAVEGIKAGVDNYLEYKKGDISADRAAVETVAETVFSVMKSAALVAGTAAVCTACSFAAAPILVAGIAGAVGWGLDAISKAVSGKSLSQNVGTLVGNVWDGTKSVAKNAWNGLKSFFTKKTRATPARAVRASWCFA